MRSLAGVFQQQGKHCDSEALYKDCLAAQILVLGNHPSVFNTKNCLAGCFEDQGRFSEAEALYKESLASMSGLLGDRHPSTLTIMSNLAGTYCNSENSSANSENLQKMRRNVLGESHPDTLKTLSSLAKCYEADDETNEADAHALLSELE